MFTQPRFSARVRKPFAWGVKCTSWEARPMKKKNFAAALVTAALALTAALPAAAQDYRGRGDGYGQNYGGYGRGGDFRRAEITVRNNGRTFSFDRGDRLFYRLLDRPFNFRPGLTY